MKIKNTIHRNETLIAAYPYQGFFVEVVHLSETIWCGKLLYAASLSEEPKADVVTEQYNKANHAAVKDAEPDWSACLNLNYLDKEKPNGLFIADQVSGTDQPEEFTVMTIPAGTYMRLRLTDETAKALGHEPWHGGIPPYQWITDDLAEKFGYRTGDSSLPIIEYYGYFSMETYDHEYRYLYVPVEKC